MRASVPARTGADAGGREVKPVSPERAGREEAARGIIAAETNLVGIDLFRLQWATRVGFLKLEAMIRDERLRRGEITIHDLTPAQRRALVDPGRLDLHALAAGPIMQPDQLYLPAGRLTLAEAKAREARDA